MEGRVQLCRSAHGWVIGTPSWAMGHFRCRPDSRMWTDDNQTMGGPMMVFPNLAVHIAQSARPAVVANTNCVMFYNADQRYQRRVIDPRGDDCMHYHLPTATWRSILEHVGADTDREELFVDPSGPAPAAIRLRQHRLAQAVTPTDADRIDPLHLEEEILQLAADVARAHTAHRRGLPRRHGATDARHRDAVRALEERIAVTFRRSVPLPDLAADVGLSPFHAARLFRRYTGMTMHSYRDHLRLREALVQLARHTERLDVLALELGYASHSHFTDRFRRTFGQPPSAIRPAQAARMLQGSA